MSALKRDLEVNYPPPDLDEPAELFLQLDRQTEMHRELSDAAEARRVICFSIREKIKAVLREQHKVNGFNGLIYNGEFWTIDKGEIQRFKYGRASELKAPSTPVLMPAVRVVSAEESMARELPPIDPDPILVNVKPVVEVDRSEPFYPTLDVPRQGAPRPYIRNSDRILANSPRRHELDSIPGDDIPL